MTKFIPTPEKEEINYSHERSVIGFLKLLASACGVFALIIAALSLTGEFILTQLGTPIEKYVFGIDILDDIEHEAWPEGQAYLRKLIGDESDGFKVVALCNKEPNAMAFPGRLIGVTTGALEAVKTEQGLAYLLGHEYGHFVHKDHLRNLGFSLGFGFALSLIGLDEFGSWISNLTGTIVSRRFSQAQEAAADEIAMELLINKYGSLDGASEFFEYMLAKNSQNPLDRVFSTHPVDQDRIAAIQAKARLYQNAPHHLDALALGTVCNHSFKAVSIRSLSN